MFIEELRLLVVPDGELPELCRLPDDLRKQIRPEIWCGPLNLMSSDLV